MYIVFFTYDLDVFFFGATTGGTLTRASKSRDEVALELVELQFAENERSGEVHQDIGPRDIPHRQAFARRECRFIEGKWVIVDEIEGAMTVFVEFEQGTYYLLMKENHREVHMATSPEQASAFADYLAQGRKIK
ncbi:MULTISPECIES: hypothetical protein [Rhizobium]|uniref:hypothetical protein n=1 Tax=Rhizobium TaxID=379 RepID=UPI0007EA7B78|nr:MULTISPECIES: hypothetical protein [Rhizobium]ANK92756.1 hypothetical protein AMK01_CH03333 [Rhizobium sp. N6212]ANK98801.1 hypothetical protein AMK00_CH03337 [Rhizobium sp. N621]ANL04929.1 hypothetical protein AMJ99_CH03413 [Rhizobium esperanzae]ANL10988.1 hypothetical protein AMJ98_CH03364 [Rhizobium sp. N1341]ANL23040.1 hypothetical protein AMJ96_CH03364 [Rhizobium sp. N113]